MTLSRPALRHPAPRRHTSRRPLRAASVALALLAAPLASTPATAQAPYPNHPIKLIVPFAPGGSNDIFGRVLATKLAARLGQPVVVENKGGGGGTIGTDTVAKSPPDGYTILFASTSITTNAASGKKLPYDVVKDLQPIGQVAAGAFAVVVTPELKVNSFADFVALAKAKPGTISYGTAGLGGINHLGTELLASAAKIKLVHVPYKGIGPAFTDLMSGNIQMTLPTIASVIPYISTGKMKGLAVTSAERSPLAPELPTVAEAGLPGFKLEVWWGILGPANLPAPILKRLNEELNAVLTLPEVKETFAREGAVPRPSTPEEYGALVKADLARWTQLIKDSKIETGE